MAFGRGSWVEGGGNGTRKEPRRGNQSANLRGEKCVVYRQRTAFRCKGWGIKKAQFGGIAGQKAESAVEGGAIGLKERAGVNNASRLVVDGGTSGGGSQIPSRRLGRHQRRHK